MGAAGFDHVGILAEGAEPFRDLAERLGLAAEQVESHPERGVDVLWLHSGPVALEVLVPTDPAGRAGAALREQGPGVHHLAFAVDDLDATLAELREAGVPLADELPREGLRETRIAFLSEAAAGGVRIELVEHSRGAPEQTNPL